jgi:Rab GDP dissociation inhibitor
MGTNQLHAVLCCCSDGCYISTGYDATTHFETTVDDVLDMYKRITGHDIDLNSKNPRLAQQQE